MSLISPIEFQSRSEIQKFQEEKLAEILRYVSESSPFYRRHFANHQVDIKKIKGLDDLRFLPVTTKDDMQNYNWDFLCVPRNQVREYTATSGTLGKPVTIALTESDLERLAYNESISFACAEGSENDVYQLMLTLDRQFMAGIAYYQGIRKLGASVVRVGPGLPAMQWEAILRLQPTTLVAVPSFLIKLLEYASEHDIDPNQSSVKKAVCIGESLRGRDFRFNLIGGKIKEKWNIDLFATYASTEMQTAFTECKCGMGGHEHPELIIVEALDDNNQPVPAGTPGEITITTLGVQGMPLVRYKTGDVAILFDEPCGCGRNTLRVGSILGRKQQLIKLKGTTIYPPGIFEILNEIPSIRDYVVEVYTNDLGTDDMRLYVVAEGPYQDDVSKELCAVMQSRLRVMPQVNITSHDALEKMQAGKGERKLRRFIDNRTNRLET